VVARSYQRYQMEMQAGKITPDQPFQITPELVACASGNFIQPSAKHGGTVNIAGGWAEQRASFVIHLVAHIVGMGPQQYVVTGYTDGMGLSSSGYIAPEMMLYVNAIYETRTIQEVTPFGMQSRTVLSNASQVLANHNFNGNIDTQVQMRMRPQDVIGAINVQHVPELASGAVEVIDLRASTTTTPVKSNFNHANPNNYLSSILGGLISGEAMARQQNRHQEMYDLAASSVADQAITRDPFLRTMASVRGVGSTNSFQFRDLIDLDANVLSDHVTKVVWRDKVERLTMGLPGEDFHSAGQTQYWYNGDRPTQIATMIANSMPGMMANLMISSISLHATNSGPGGIPFMMHSGVDSLIPGIDVSSQAEILKEQFRIHLINDISYNNAKTYNIHVTAHLMGEIWISLHVEGFDAVDFVMPAYANSLMAPVVTRSRQNLTNLALQFSELKNELIPASGVAAPAQQFWLPSGATKY
jgi:hypothetical protein